MRTILFGSSFFFPSTPATLDTFLSFTVNSDRTKLTAKFCLEQLRALILAKKLGVKCRSWEGTDADDFGAGASTGCWRGHTQGEVPWRLLCCCGCWAIKVDGDSTCWEATGVVGMSGGNCCWETGVVGGNSGWKGGTMGGNSGWEEVGTCWEARGVVGGMNGYMYSQLEWSLWIIGGSGWDNDCSILRTWLRTNCTISLMVSCCDLNSLSSFHMSVTYVQIQ